MKSVDRQKICPNCNGRLSLEASECPYCATEFPESVKSSSPPLIKNSSLQDSLASLYTPPYNNKTFENTNLTPKKQVVFTEPTPPIAEGFVANDGEEASKNSFWALFALIAGGNLLMLGLLQFFFSEEGVLQLQWNSSYWYLYCLIAFPLFYLGFKKASD